MSLESIKQNIIDQLSKENSQIFRRAFSICLEHLETAIYLQEIEDERIRLEALKKLVDTNQFPAKKEV